jgi:hypothetical protein
VFICSFYDIKNVASYQIQNSSKDGRNFIIEKKKKIDTKQSKTKIIGLASHSKRRKKIIYGIK